MESSDRRLSLALLLFIANLFFANLFLAMASTDPRDLAALQRLYECLNNPPELTNWSSTGGDPCGESWSGITCFGQSVVSIRIKGMGVGGVLCSELANLLSLKELDVSYNNIGGEIPYGLPPHATHINLAMNNFTYSIPHSLSSMKALRHLNVSHNSLSGPIGNVFTDLQNLEKLDLSFNHFTGDLPTSFGSLSRLHTLYLQNNEFTGSVILLTNLPLFILYLEDNHFSGYVPRQFGYIPILRIYGNLFQPGFDPPPVANSSIPQFADSNIPQSIANSSIPQSVSNSSIPSFLSADKNVSQSPKFTPSSFGFASVQGHGSKKRKSKLGVVAGTVSGVFLVVLFAGVIIVIRSHRYHKRNLRMYGSSTENLVVLPSSAPTVGLDQSICGSLHLTCAKLPSLHHIKSEGTSRKKSCTRRSKNLTNARLFSVSELSEATKGYSAENIVGHGSIGCVYKAELPDGQILAVKKIGMVPLAVSQEDDFLDVLWNMSRLRHPNISTLIGYCVEQGEHILVHEYARNGSLDNIIFSAVDKQKALSWKARMRVALGVAHAIEYMHWICSPPVAHGNIKASNILLDNDFTPYLSDCGLTMLRHLVATESKASKAISSNGYAAPELNIPGADKMKIDVYSFGVVMLELLTGRRAFDSSRTKEEQYLVRWASTHLHDFSSLEGIVDPTIHGKIPPKALSRFADIILLCIQPEPEFRSPMTDITGSMLDLIRSMIRRQQQHNSSTNNKKPSTSDESSEFNMSEISYKSSVPYLEVEPPPPPPPPPLSSA